MKKTIGWLECKLEKCTEILDSKRVPINNKERNFRIEGKSKKDLYPYYGATGEIGKIDGYIFDEELLILGEDGVSFLDGKKNKAYLIRGKSWVNNHAHVLKAIGSITTNKYLLYYLNQFNYQGFVNGGTRLKLTQSNMRKIPIFIPPLEEQKQISQKLDSFLSKVEKIKSRLESIPEILEKFRQSVLNDAVTGKLTEDWRKDKELSSINDILAFCDGIKKDKKTESLVKKDFLDTELEISIPKNWVWVRLCRISEVASGVAKGSKIKGDTLTLPYLRVANVQRGYLDLNEIKTIEASVAKAEKLYLKKGDILFNEGGDLDKLGRGWVWDEQVENCIHQNHVFRARLYFEDCEPKYISFYGNSLGRQYFIKSGSQTVNLANINKTSLSLLPIPLPPVEEQSEIVKRVENLFSYADKIEEKVIKAKKRVDNLTQSILSKAFKGELTKEWRKNNPDLITGENSAEALLEKIKQERKKEGKSKKRKKA